MRLQLAILLFSPFLLFTLVESKDGGCPRPELKHNVEAPGLQLFSPPGTEAYLVCANGYTASDGSGILICTLSGIWRGDQLICRPKMCPAIDPVINGVVHFEDNVYLSVVNFTCNNGYILNGARSVVCQANSSWSAPSPECKAVTCPMPPIPENAMIVYDLQRTNMGDIEFGVKGTYKCQRPMVLIGNPRAECTAFGNWTEPPVCRMVTCPIPEPIENGHMSSFREGRYKDIIKYGCIRDYILIGHPYVECLETGEWSTKPSCGAPCTVAIKRGRILYNRRKLWIEDLEPNKVLHNEQVSFYCKNEAGKCGYAVSSHCNNGILPLPECFEEPGLLQYNTRPGSLPSEIRQC